MVERVRSARRGAKSNRYLPKFPALPFESNEERERFNCLPDFLRRRPAPPRVERVRSARREERA